MALKTTALVLLHLVLSFIFSFSLSDDILCLKSIKDSLADPFHRLESWNFENTTRGVICKLRGIICWNDRDDRVLFIDLSGYGLEGNFPRGIQHCKSLNGLDLSNNSLSGSIPSDIANLIPYVTTLNLSHNSFFGEIPRGLASCKYLNFLLLDRNRFDGNFPLELTQLRRLKHFSASNNMLSGQVPDFPTAVIAEGCYENNHRLCGGPLNRCRKKNRDDDSFNDGFGIGYAVSAVTSFISFSLYLLQAKNAMKKMLNSMLQKRNTRKEDSQLHFPTINHTKEVLFLFFILL